MNLRRRKWVLKDSGVANSSLDTIKVVTGGGSELKIKEIVWVMTRLISETNKLYVITRVDERLT